MFVVLSRFMPRKKLAVKSWMLKDGFAKL